MGSSKLDQLKFLSVNSFGSVMGISGLSLAGRLSHNLFGTSSLIAELIGLMGIIMFVLLSVFFAIKLLKFPSVVYSEFSSPIGGNFYGAITVAILLLSSVILPYNRILGQSIWIIGTSLTLLLSYFMVSRLFKVKQDPLHAVPAMLIPAVAILNVPITGVAMPFAWIHELNLFCIAVGGVSSLIFLTMIFTRLIHHEPMAAGMNPSLLILIAPFEVGFLAYVSMTKSIDMFASTLFYFGLFLFMVLFFKAVNKSIPFSTAWWAVSFPLAVLSNAASKYAQYVNTWPTKFIAAFILILTTFVIVIIFIRTIKHLISGKLLQG
ncbi:C4-dicarboxylate ABC transporter [Paenibacillus sp. CGMCC 1.16610]|uniref:C4-dicarboxylate ABC transporter n=1 Tax=Paenibacillus anseongense TaxID=2682845 RepID=A0ABW9UGK7_9BACL|nr:MULTISPECIES: SLAC1 anion channel family protein [Paenibacillus]MBA2939641.1 C4-dicarboxylate ABC transporter [Paenibacillus sp. CGMCC 1.16610]MVQ39302.1 C4-dicarboxylate ABC transporter [Paenibacillus anseongense]